MDGIVAGERLKRFFSREQHDGVEHDSDDGVEYESEVDVEGNNEDSGQE